LVIGQGVWILWGVENCHLPLTKPVAVNTGLALLAARDLLLIFLQFNRLNDNDVNFLTNYAQYCSTCEISV